MASQLAGNKRGGAGGGGGGSAWASAGAAGAGLGGLSPFSAGARLATSEDADAAAVRRVAVPLHWSHHDYDALLDSIGDASVVLLGEASHGTHEFYRERARITKRLILEKGFTAVALEADWPAAYAVNRYVRGLPPLEPGEGEEANEERQARGGRAQTRATGSSGRRALDGLALTDGLGAGRSGTGTAAMALDDNEDADGGSGSEPDSEPDAVDALTLFNRRFPAWMWRNADFLDFVGWLRQHNEQARRSAGPAPRSAAEVTHGFGPGGSAGTGGPAFQQSRAEVGVYGLDLYALYESMDAVIRHLEAVDPAAAQDARRHYACFSGYGGDSQEYGYSAGMGLARSCEGDAISVLLDLHRGRTGQWAALAAGAGVHGVTAPGGSGSTGPAAPGWRSQGGGPAARAQTEAAAVAEAARLTATAAAETAAAAAAGGTGGGASGSSGGSSSTTAAARFKHGTAAAPPSPGDPDAAFAAEQNAALVVDAERYYREMFRGRASSWNLRDAHMVKTLAALRVYLTRRQQQQGEQGQQPQLAAAHGGAAPPGRPAKIVVWAHNSHLGDASATEMAEQGEVNLGQLARATFGQPAVFNVGFSTYTGTVTAASAWDGPAERKRVRPGLEGSYEALFHRMDTPRFVVLLRQLQATAAAAGDRGASGQQTGYPGGSGVGAKATFTTGQLVGGAATGSVNAPAADEATAAADALRALRKRRLQRAIGVIYKPRTERGSHYFHTTLPAQFDAVIHVDETRAVEPLERGVGWHPTGGEVPDTYPEGL